MDKAGRTDLAHDFILPTVLFAALGGMSWAVRGSSGFGAMNGCVFAGVLWGAAWWFIAREPAAHQTRPYTSGWIILALTVGIGISGNRGWMQWPSFFIGQLQTNTAEGKFVPISPIYGFIWLFIAGVPWAGLGACLLAWCNAARPLRAHEWVVRLASGIGAAFLATWFYNHFPELFLPLYKSMQAEYGDFASNPNLRRLVNDCRAAIMHLGLFLGFLGFELFRRDWRSFGLILTVGLANGVGWALCQNWKWASGLWPNTSFNWWRCWESCGGISIGVAYGIAYFLVNRRISGSPTNPQASIAANPRPNLERLGAGLGLVLGLGLSIKNGLKGWANIYLGREDYWNQRFWMAIGPLMIAAMVALVIWIRAKPLPRGFQGDAFPNAYQMMWAVLITQNILAQMVTGPFSAWNEVAFNIYYALLFLLSAVIIYHLHCLKSAAPAKGM